MDLMRDWTLAPPLDQGVEHELAAPCQDREYDGWIPTKIGPTIGVFLPAVELIVDRKGYTLLETAVRVGCPSNDVSTQLEAQGHVEIFGDIRFGPYLLHAIGFVDERRVLNSSPPEESVVTDKWGNFAISAR